MFYNLFQSPGLTVIASESCLARGVDHSLVSELSEEDHLLSEHDTLQFQITGLRARFREQLLACLETIDLIAALIYCHRCIAESHQK